jgi:exonuclease SbcC
VRHPARPVLPRHRAQQTLPAVDAPELAQRFDALVSRIRAARRPAEPERPAPAAVKSAPAPDQTEARAAMEASLAAMEAALEEGSLQAAAEQDRTLRAMDFKAMRPGEAALARLARLRAELARLQGWARWGGNVSREELLKTAQDLATQEMPVAERATKVGSLRERWKSLDASAGPASRDAWLRFDAACTEAYAPVAEHFRQLAEERKKNLEHAAQLTADVASHAESLALDGDPAAIDWKAVSASVNRAIQSWQRLGPIERRERKSADAAFSAALDLLRKPLAAQQQRELARREALIAEVEALDAGAPRVTESLRAIQERWQEQARALPLSRADEQALWQRFRQACDALFAERKESAKTLDAERQQHLERREALCAALEAAVDAPVATLGQLLRDSAAAWRDTGPVPRAAQQQIEARYGTATTALRQRIDTARQAASAAQADLLRQKFALCRQAEQALVDGKLDAPQREALQSAWHALPPLGGGNERTMSARFDAAIAGTDAEREALRRNRDLVMEEILQMEIRLGVESPPELSQQRLKQQIQVLQSSLRSGQRQVEPQAMLMQLCAQPALLDDAAAARVERLIREAQ